MFLLIDACFTSTSVRRCSVTISPKTNMHMDDFSNLSVVCVCVRARITGDQPSLRYSNKDASEPFCAPLPLSVHLLLDGAELQRAELGQRGLQLLFAVLHLLLQPRVDAAQLSVLRLDVRLLGAQLLDSGLQLWQRKRWLLIKLRGAAAVSGHPPLSVCSRCSPDLAPESSAPPQAALSVFASCFP